MTNWKKIISDDKKAVALFANGKYNCEEVQVRFRNTYPESSAELRNVIRNRGTAKARQLARRALQRN